MKLRPPSVDLREAGLPDVNAALDRMNFDAPERAHTPRAAPRHARFASIVVAFDGSEGARLALQWARVIAKAHGSRVTIATVTEPPQLSVAATSGAPWWPGLVDAYQALQTALARQNAEAVAELARHSIAAESVVEEGSVGRGLADIAETARADLVIVGATRRGAVGRALLGTTATSILSRTSASVLIAREAPNTRPVLAATDGSHVSYRAVAFALDLATRVHAELVIDRVIETPDTLDPPAGFAKGVVDRLQIPAPPPRVRYVMDTGAPAARLLERATDDANGLIVLGSHGKGTLERMLIGSVSRRVAEAATTSVLVVKDPLGRDAA
ncbi:MAG: universal stress protein [Thermoplasmatota archaeon]